MAARPSLRYHNAQHSDLGYHYGKEIDRRYSVQSDASSEAAAPNPGNDQYSKSSSSSSSVKRLVKTITGKNKHQSSSSSKQSSGFSNALIKTNSNNNSGNMNMTSLMRKLMDSKKRSSATATLVVPADFIAEDLKKSAARATKVSSLHKKLLAAEGTPKSSSSSSAAKPKLLGDSNARGRELELEHLNKRLRAEIAELRMSLSNKNAQIELLQGSEAWLKELCCKQQQEIQMLKDGAAASPEKPSAELKQARQVLPALQKQVTSLTAQLNFLAEGLAEMKSDKEAIKAYIEGHNGTPKTPSNPRQEAEDAEGLGISSPFPLSPDESIFNDVNPCLTPYYARTKTEAYEVDEYRLTTEEQLAEALENLACDSVQKVNVLQECNPNVRPSSASVRKAGRRASLGKENSHASANVFGRTPHQKLCWD